MKSYAADGFNEFVIAPGYKGSDLIFKGDLERVKVVRGDVRDHFYVEDGAAAYMTLAEKLAEDPNLRGEAFNFSNEIQVNVLEIVHKIIALMGSQLEPEIRNEVTNEILHQFLSAEKARNILGWQPLFSLEEGLQRTIAWYRNFLGED